MPKQSDMDQKLQTMYRREFRLNAEEFVHVPKTTVIERVRDLEEGLRDLLAGCDGKETNSVAAAKRLLERPAK